jgi:hypothetical protein
MAHHVLNVTLEPGNYTTTRDATKAYYSDEQSALPASTGQETG